MATSSKGEKIKRTMALNKSRRDGLAAKVYSLKIDESHLSKTVRANLEGVFLEAKWLYNAMLSDDSVFSRDYKNREVIVKKFNNETQKCDLDDKRILQMGSQLIQALIDRAKQNVYNLAKAKRLGKDAGKLKFAKEICSVPLKQFGVTHKLSGANHLRLQNIGRVRVRGLDQIKGKELASAILYKDANGFYVKILTYESRNEVAQTEGPIGLDFGIKDSIVTSDGRKFDWNFEMPDELMRKCKKFSKTKKGSRNREKARKKLGKSYLRLCNRKEDAANKFVSSLKRHSKVVIQDENIKGWHAGLFGKKVQQSILGRIKAKIKNLETSVVISRWLPTTKMSPLDGKLVDIGLNERTFNDGAFSEDRDIKSAKTILCLGLYKPDITRKELMGLPVEDLVNVFSNYKFESDKLIPLKQEATSL